MRKICIVVGSRANYSSIKSVMSAIQKHSDLELQLVLGASALLDRYGLVSEQIKKDGFEPLAEVYMLIEGETPTTMAKSTGVGLMELSTVFDKLKPDIVLTVGDRFETMATTLAAAYMNIPVAHTMGGEVTGTIDESIRHAVTKFSHIHFPASKDAKERIIKLGEREEDVYLVGCPRIDLVKEILNYGSEGLEESLAVGVGGNVNIDEPFILVSQHPVTTEYGEGEKQINMTLEALQKIGLPSIVLWPNADAGSDDIARGMRKWREKGLDKNMHFYKNLPIEHYIHIMSKTACLVGNSSSGIREGAYIGTPVVNIGTRQYMRERGKNVLDVPNKLDEIIQAIEEQIANGFYDKDPVYGDGTAGVQIANVLTSCNWKIQKTITY
jgi:UDP-hydrolysing UDP-N-acetyl-D-glucosamine 2-epimerase